MTDKCAEKLTLLATSIAFELVRNKSPQEISDLRYLVGQILSTINTISGLKK